MHALYYDKILTTVGSDIYDNFGLLPITSFTDPVKLKREKSLKDQKNYVQALFLSALYP